MSAEFAEMEGAPTVPGTPERRSDWVYEIRHLATKLRAISMLDAYNVAVYNLGFEDKRNRYFVIQYDRREQKLTVAGFAREDIEKASARYAEAEQEASAKGRNVVLVSADSLDQLRSAYPNYFLDAGKFTNLLWRTTARK